MENRISSFDSLRGIASFIVVIFHCLISFKVFHNAHFNGEYKNIFMKIFSFSPIHTFWAGNEAVLLFFILSGFVLSLPFLEKRAPLYRVYLVKRFCRIYIPYIVIMLISVLFVYFFAVYEDTEQMSDTYNNRWDHSPSLKVLIYYLFMLNQDTTNVNGVVWSLYHEMRISLIFPLIILIITRYNWKKSLLFLTGMNISLFYIVGFLSNLFSEGVWSILLYSVSETIYYTIFFIFGAILAKYKNEVIKFIKSVQKIIKYLLVIFALILINSKWISLLIQINGFYKDLIPAVGILILFSLVLSSEKLKFYLTKKPLITLGKISYSLYLTHIPVIMMAGIYLSKMLPIAVSIALVPLISLPIAYFAYKFIEVPSINLGKKLSVNLTSKKLRQIEIKTKEKEII